MKLYLYTLFLIPCFLMAQTETSVRLYYENDAYKLQGIHLKKIDSIKQAIALVDSVAIHISGYTNTYGSDRYNVLLSERRAREVQIALDQKERVIVEAFGELESGSPQNRRVEILISSYNSEKEVEVPIQEIAPIQETETETVSETVSVTPVNDLSNLKVGDKIVLKGILFIGGSDTILTESKIALEELYAYLNSNAVVQIKLIGHICCNFGRKPHQDGRNSRTGRNQLSKDRAKAVYGYLIDKGISKKRLTYEGRAYLEPLGKGNKYDRRVEVEIIE